MGIGCCSTTSGDCPANVPLLAGLAETTTKSSLDRHLRKNSSRDIMQSRKQPLMAPSMCRCLACIGYAGTMASACVYVYHVARKILKFCTSERGNEYACGRAAHGVARADC
jgi:hypothetical protein